jgi:hypothetical protein
MESVTNMGPKLLSLTSGKETTSNFIEHRDCSQAHRTLGMWPTPNGSSQAQFEVSLVKSERFAQGVIKAPMSRYEACISHWTMCIPSITFGLGSTLLTPDQLDLIPEPMMNATLPKMGCSSKPCRHVVFGPTKFLGVGARDLTPERGVQQTLLLLKHVRSNTALSALMRMCLEWFQLHSGLSRPILECPDLDLPYLENGWYKSLRSFLCSINATTHVGVERVPQTLREKDQSIMETFVQMQHCNSTELCRLNLCRMHLQAEFLSETCTSESNSILPEAWQGIRPRNSCSAFLWPKQARPFEKSWNLWREAIKLAYLGPQKYCALQKHAPPCR